MKYYFFGLLAMFVIASCDKEEMNTPGLLVPPTADQDPDIPSLSINGTLLHVESFGNPADPILIIIHGGPGGDYRSMTRATQLTEDGYFVVFYDQRGTGLSKREDRSQYEGKDAIPLFIDDLDALVSHFRTEPDQKVFLAGHSWGAMLATGYVNQHPEKITGVILAEPGGFTWDQTLEYLSRSNHIEFFSEALNDAIFPEQIFAGRDEHEVLDYKATYFSSFENAPGNAIGNAGPYPFWRNGAVSFSALIDNADRNGFDLKSDLSKYSKPILFLYSEFNTAYGLEWAEEVSSAYPHADLQIVKGSGHEMFYFGWEDMYPRMLTYLNGLK